MDLLARCPARSSTRILTDGSEEITLESLRCRVSDAAKRLNPEGATTGQVRPFQIQADVDGMIELLATWAAGLIAAPLNPKLTDDARQQATAALSSVSTPPGTCVVLWTSGTSGQPRGVALSWANLEASARAAETRLGLCADDVWLASLSPAHVGGLALITRALLLGNRLIAMGQFDVARMVALLESDDGPTHLSLVPTQLHQIREAWRSTSAPPRLRCALIGGAHTPRTLVERVTGEGWPIALTYGATEMTSQVATATPAEVTAGLRGVGLPLDGVEVRVAQDGEILLRGPTRALGYVGEVTASLTNESGWYHTGDLGRLDGDGRLTITGRRIDRIVTGGVTLDAIAIEEDLRLHPTVVDVCVVGVPDDVWGERVAAWVEPVHGEFDLDEFEAWVSRAMAPSARPRVWRVGDPLPRNANGKIDRACVRSTF